ncbi:MAG: inorganic diphosphatase [Kiloniellales bacterium]|nr:inorganic diphosphatase [Kiloniellales bacterium]
MIEVLIQAEAGSSEKMRFDEGTLEPIATGRVSRPYPYSYGFILGTTAADGDSADCYVFGDDKLQSGSIVACDVVGLLEQIESGEPDHKVLAVVAGEEAALPDRALEVLQDFIYGIFSDYPNTSVKVGPIHPRDAALKFIRECRKH